MGLRENKDDPDREDLLARGERTAETERRVTLEGPDLMADRVLRDKRETRDNLDDPVTTVQLDSTELRVLPVKMETEVLLVFLERKV